MSLNPVARVGLGRRIARVVFSLALLALAGLLIFHHWVPDVFGLGLIADNLAPWLGVLVLLAIVPLALIRGKLALVSWCVPAIAWTLMFGTAVLPATTPPAASSLIMATQNAYVTTNGLLESELTGGSVDVLSVQEISPEQVDDLQRELSDVFPHYVHVGTVAVFSKYPLRNTQALDLGLGWKRALRTDVITDQGPLRLYAVHAASARPADHASRDRMLDQLESTIATDSAARIVAMGDFNATSTDRNMSGLLKYLRDTPSSHWGLGMTWPDRPFPVMRLDHVLISDSLTGSSRTISVKGSDHRGVIATLAPVE
ncbi:endonuclease/exonuclease/phosphatase family protein [Glutamicibacter endophyticus]|uniref:endonuclease/exonuclease/phosphatase family protein n=1 Tax=Glutamicibacter endophyticus TaxID=1522174 RepID=UPI003AEFB2F7